MWPFKRKKDLSTPAPEMPPELNQYYQAEKRQQNVVTWLLGLATLAVTIAIAFLLFMGARWVVQKVRNNNDKAPVATEQQSPDENSEAPAETTNTPSTATTGSGQTPQGTQGATTAQNTPQTSSATTALPKTGPADTIAVFMIATAVGTFAYKRSARHQ